MYTVDSLRPPNLGNSNTILHSVSFLTRFQRGTVTVQLDFFLSDKVTVKIMFPLFKGTDFWEKLSTEIIKEQNRSQIKTVNGLDVIDFHGIKFLRFFSALIFYVKFAHDSCTNIYFWTRDEAIQKTILSKISNFFVIYLRLWMFRG